MDNQTLFVLLGAALLALGAAAVLWTQRRRQKRLLERLQAMLDAAIDGSFTEHTYDESRLSALESRMNRYLSECAVSSRNLAREKEKIKSLISDISHQTKTPIANLLLYAQLLAEQPLPPESRPCVEALTAQAEKLNFLIGALVKASRLENGILAVTPREQAVSLLLDDALAQIAPKADAKKIALHGPPSVSGTALYDRKWTVEALLNLLDNAVKYSPEGSEIRVTAQPYELFYRVDVTDQGIGISEADTARIFTRFYRAAEVRDREGVGIGLYLTREILAAEGGYLKVESAPGRGSTFSMFLRQP